MYIIWIGKVGLINIVLEERKYQKKKKFKKKKTVKKKGDKKVEKALRRVIVPISSYLHYSLLSNEF